MDLRMQVGDSLAQALFDGWWRVAFVAPAVEPDRGMVADAQNQVARNVPLPPGTLVVSRTTTIGLPPFVDCENR